MTLDSLKLFSELKQKFPELALKQMHDMILDSLKLFSELKQKFPELALKQMHDMILDSLQLFPSAKGTIQSYKKMFSLFFKHDTDLTEFVLSREIQG